VAISDNHGGIAVLGKHRSLARGRSAAAVAAEIREEEARRIAGILHDESSQLLSVLNMKMDEIASSATAEQGSQIVDARQLVQALQAQLRTLSHELRPPMLDHMGLVPTLEFLAHNLGLRYGKQVEFACPTHRRYAVVIETAIYRFVFEALTNTGKHSGATHAWVTLRHTRDKVVCRVEDNGVGMGVTPGGCGASEGLGLRGMSERIEAAGGRLTIAGCPGQGVVLTAEIPLKSGRSHSPATSIRYTRRKLLTAGRNQDAPERNGLSDSMA